jgi:hypothetical protein
MHDILQNDDTDWFKWIHQWEFTVNLYMLDGLTISIFLSNKVLKMDE